MDKQPPPAEPPALAQKERPRWSGALLWIGVLVFIVYPLSIGPAAMLAEKLPATDTAVHVFYAPLQALVCTCSPLADFFESYVDLWTSL